MELTLIILNALLTLMFVSIAYFFKKNYPKEINDLVGYRTKRSMSSEENWLKANKYSSGLLFQFSVFLLPIQLLLYMLFNLEVALFGMIGIWIIMLVVTIVKTEAQLKSTDIN